MAQAGLGKLGKWQWIKAGIISILTGGLTAVMAALSTYPPQVELKAVLAAMAVSAIAYIIKELGTNDQGQLGRPDGWQRDEEHYYQEERENDNNDNPPNQDWGYYDNSIEG